MSSFYAIQTGLWQDHSLSGAETTQWTLSIASSALLLTSIATFIGVVGTQVWSIVAFFVHFARSTPGRHDGFHHGQQAIYRNNGSPLGVIWSLFRLLVAYGGRKSWYCCCVKRTKTPYASKRAWRFVLSVSLALFFWAGFRVASVFSANVTGHLWQTSEVRIAPNVPGIISWNTTQTAGQHMYQRYNIQSATQALAYVNTCYNTTANPGCATLPQQKLIYSTATTSECPFGRYCKVDAIVLETPWLDSHTDFGINAAPADRIQFRKQATCAVLDVAALTGPLISLGNGLYSHEFFLGPIMNGTQNATDFTAYAIERPLLDPTGYSIGAYYHYQGAGAFQTWKPSRDFNISDGDVSLFNIAFGNLAYQSPVSDPLFSAHNDSSLKDGTYQSDSVAGLVACIDRYQLQTSSHITPLTSLNQLTGPLQDDNAFTKAQSATALRLLLPSYTSWLYVAVNGLGVSALRAQRNVFSVVSTGLPSDQYRIEMQGWFETSLSLLQHQVVEFAAKDFTRIVPLDEYSVMVGGGVHADDILAPDELFTVTFAPPGFERYVDDFRGMATQQRIRNIAGYQSFSFVGIIVIFAAGLFLVIFSWFVEQITKGVLKIESWCHCKKRTTKAGTETNVLLMNGEVEPQTRVSQDGPNAERGHENIPLRNMNGAVTPPLPTEQYRREADNQQAGGDDARATKRAERERERLLPGPETGSSSTQTRLDRWKLDSVFHLQRLTFEKVDPRGKWEWRQEDIPVTRDLLEMNRVEEEEIVGGIGEV